MSLYKEITGKDGFSASDGWLQKFKERHGIKTLSISGARLSASIQDETKFCKSLALLLTDEIDDLDNVYNADKTGFYWKTLPKRTLVGRNEQSAPGLKEPKDRLTILNGANSTGTHAIPLFIIGKFKKPRCFRNKHYMPFFYDAQKSA